MNHPFIAPRKTERRRRAVTLGRAVLIVAAGMAAACCGILAQTTTTHYEIRNDAIFANGKRLPSKTFAGTIESVDIRAATITVQEGKEQLIIQMRSIVYLEVKGTRDWLVKGFYGWPPPLPGKGGFAGSVPGNFIQGVIFQDKPNKNPRWECYTASISLTPQGEAALVDAQAAAQAAAQEQAAARQRAMAARKEQQDADRRALVAAWRASGSRVELPEEAQRHRALAEAAFEEKNFQKAASEYTAALQIYPTWPAGHYNLAAICAELQRFSEAVEHMHMYLELVPDAPDAQEAKEKVWVWEDKGNPTQSSGRRGKGAK